MTDTPSERPEQLQAQIEALQRQLEQMKREQAKLSGSGAIAQGGGDATAALGDHSTAIGRVEGSVYIGPPIQNPDQALRYYRQVMANAHRHIPLRSLDRSAGDARQKPLSLTAIYIDLETTKQAVDSKGEPGRKHSSPADETQPDLEQRPIRALEAVIAHRRLVLLGDPGSGKSTFVNHLAYCLAAQPLEPAADWLAHLPGWPAGEGDLLPLVVTLRDFARHYADKLPGKAEPRHLWDFIAAWLADKNLGFAAEPLRRQLEQGRVLALLDGLDEVPTLPQRRFVRDAAAAFMERYPGNRYLVTCRTLAYQPSPGDDLRLPGEVPAYELAPFDESRIDGFIAAWYRELTQAGVVKNEEEAGFREQLQQAVRQTDLWRLAGNPLLLTVMALIHTRNSRLPDARALLYEESIDILLWRWDESKTDGSGELPRLRHLLQEAGRADTDLKRVVRELAYQVHGQTQGNSDPHHLADIGELRLQKALATLKVDDSGQADTSWADRLIQVMKLRAGLLLERAPEVFTFPHRTFQEYLAGAHLAGQPDFARQAAELAGQGAQWREVILLAVGHLVYKIEETTRPLALVGELCPTRSRDNAIAWRKAWLAGEALLEIGVKRAGDSELGRDVLERVRRRLADLVTQGQLSPRERAEAGDTLARLGDPRPEVMTVDGMQFCYVPPGPFEMGSDEHSNEKPPHTFNIEYGYWLARYPVTVAQWAEFVEDSGHEPRDRDSLRDPANRPVRWVNWREAVKFCEWLTERMTNDELRMTNGLPQSKIEVRLPSEAEWEKAARGGAEIPAEAVIKPLPEIAASPEGGAQIANPTPRRRYPWGDKIDENRVNYYETGIGTTSAVGSFPGGSTPYGCEEMAGNVWEWTRTIWGEDFGKPDYGYPYVSDDGREDETDVRLRVLRGGSFGNSSEFARCAARSRSSPGSHFRSYGFRVCVVVSPLLTSDL